MKLVKSLLVGVTLSLVGCQDKEKQAQTQVEEPIKELRLSDYKGLERQVLLDEISEEIDHPFTNITYDSDGSKLANYTTQTLTNLGVDPTQIKAQTGEKDLTKGKYSARVVDVTISFPKQTEVPLFIGNELFTKFGSFSKEDLKHVIIYHEGTHAKQLKEQTNLSQDGRRRDLILNHKSSTKFDYLMCDAEARYYELVHFKGAELTADYKQQTARNFLTGCYALQQMKLSEKQKEAIQTIPHVFDPKTIKYAVKYAK